MIILLASCRYEDGVLMLSVELALILIYLSVLLITSCEVSSTVCAGFGLGDTSSGILLVSL